MDEAVTRYRSIKMLFKLNEKKYMWPLLHVYRAIIPSMQTDAKNADYN